MIGSTDNVFVNCPFDEAYKPSFEVLLFTVAASGYSVRCALEEDDAGDIRFDKLCRLIKECEKSIHDLSRIDLGASGLPRFNMPFELGLFMGAKRFGGKAHRGKTALVMIGEPYRLPVYLSDLGGNDSHAHRGRPEEVVRIVRGHLHTRPDGTSLPGAARILETFDRFKTSLPEMAAMLGIARHEIDPYRDYRVSMELLTEFLRLA